MNVSKVYNHKIITKDENVIYVNFNSSITKVGYAYVPNMLYITTDDFVGDCIETCIETSIEKIMRLFEVYIDDFKKRILAYMEINDRNYNGKENSIHLFKKLINNKLINLIIKRNLSYKNKYMKVNLRQMVRR